MICLGMGAGDKDAEIVRYCEANAISRVFVLSPERFPMACSVPGSETIEWNDLIEYRYYYRLLQEIDRNTLVVVNECLRTQNRHALTYNCIRLFLNQTPHKLIFQYLPMIDTIEDMMILIDFETRSRWKREPFSADRLKECQLRVQPVPVGFAATPVVTTDKTKTVYAETKRELIDGIGLKDPHTIPRNLYLLSGKEKVREVSADRRYVGRNNRFKLANLSTFKEAAYPYEYAVFEFPHNFGEFADFLALSAGRQHQFNVLVADLKVDRWYYQRYQEWAGRLADAYSVLQQQENRP